LIPVNDFISITGQGVQGTIDNKKIALGNKKLMENIGASCSELIESKIIANQKLGKTVSYISIDSTVVGYISINDSIKESSKTAIKELLKQGIEVIMLTGDNENTAKAVANELHLNSYQSNCMPEDKLLKIKELQSEGKSLSWLVTASMMPLL